MESKEARIIVRAGFFVVIIGAVIVVGSKAIPVDANLAVGIPEDD